MIDPDVITRSQRLVSRSSRNTDETIDQLTNSERLRLVALREAEKFIKDELKRLRSETDGSKTSK